MERWLLNGAADICISPTDRGLAYGDGLFETIAIRNGRCRFLEDHLRRLTEGCARLAMPAPNLAVLRNELEQLRGDQASGEVRHGVAKLIITRGTGPRGYRPPDNCQPSRLVGVAHSSVVAAMPAQVRYCTTRLATSPAVAGLKTLGRLEQVLARAELAGDKDQEGLMLNHRDEVVCGTMTNLFVVRSGMLLTPTLNESGVRGIMRHKVIGCANQLGINVRQCTLTTGDLSAADEIFLTNSLLGIWPVGELDGRVMAPGLLTKQLRQELVKIGVEECAA